MRDDHRGRPSRVFGRGSAALSKRIQLTPQLPVDGRPKSCPRAARSADPWAGMNENECQELTSVSRATGSVRITKRRRAGSGSSRRQEVKAAAWRPTPPALSDSLLRSPAGSAAAAAPAGSWRCSRRGCRTALLEAAMQRRPARAHLVTALAVSHGHFLSPAGV